MKRLAFVLLVACSTEAPEKPSPTPPPPWGVPISGGTLLISRDGKFAVIADPDRDRILSVDLATREVASEIALEPGDEPGRLVEDGAGRIHVALRHAGALFTMSSPLADSGTRLATCGEPRGLAWQASTDQIHLACNGGELVTIAAGSIVRTLRLDRDLRDVVVDGDTLRVSRFRSAELLTIDATGAVIDRSVSPVVKRLGNVFNSTPCPTCDVATTGEPEIVDAVPAVAWRTVGLPDGAVLVSHQRQVKREMRPEPEGYAGGCQNGPVEHAVTVMRPGQPAFAVKRLLTMATLPVDAAVSPDGTRIAFLIAGGGAAEVPITSLAKPDLQEEDRCGDTESIGGATFDLGLATSVAYTPDGKLAIFYPEVPALTIGKEIVKLTGELGYDSGRALFHARTASGLACASCHPEGRDDGLVWNFERIGPRRTQNLAGGVLARAPFHWNADLADLDALISDVFSGRMQGGMKATSARISLGPWLDRIPAPKGVVTDAAAVDRGRVLFDAPSVGCATCHNGAQLTNNQRFDIGKGLIKVPSLVGVGARAPFMHDGCAATLADRFGACGGGDLHGTTSQLTAAQIADLVAYLESL